MKLYRKHWGQTYHFTKLLFQENIMCGYDVVATYEDQKFTAASILFRAIRCKKSDILMFYLGPVN